MPKYIGAIDQGTTSTRFIIFDEKGKHITSQHHEFEQIYPRPGWVEHDPYDLLDSVIRCADGAIRKFGLMGYNMSDLKAVGICNQRETTLVWDRKTGEPLYNAIVWSDTRTDSLVKELLKKQQDLNVQELCGLPIHNYFSAVKLKWLIERVPKVKQAVEKRRAMFGTVDTWLIWNLTGGIQGGKYITDVTNASRTMFMNLKTCQWDPRLLDFFEIPDHMLPVIVSSSENYGTVQWGPLEGIPLMGCLGDQQAALVGQKCFEIGQAKNTYGTGAFLLMNVGNEPIVSKHGLLSTIAYQFGPNGQVSYALEGSISVAGAAIKWLRDNIGIIQSPDDIDTLAAKVKSTGGVFFVTAFSGLFAPYWRGDARGTLVGLTQYTNKYHLARATLEAVCFSTRAILEAMNIDRSVALKTLKADGGMSNSDQCMQIQADVLGIPVCRSALRDTSALGAAFAAGLAAGIWNTIDDIKLSLSEKEDVFYPQWDDEGRKRKCHQWQQAVQRSLGWTEVYTPEDHL
ncbi:Putative Glycerol kinase [Rhizopus microsporus]|nr:Putative Glycerol kinase [Rhizopus microsporus]